MKDNDKKLFDQLKKVSSRIGKDINLIQVNGGNTSIKIDDFLYVKASGKHLAKAEEEDIFAKILLKDNEDYKEYLTKKSIKKEIRPSIEKDLHKLITTKIVLHTHPIDLISLTMTQKGKNRIIEQLKDYKWSWVNYSKPGKDLAKEIENVIQKETNVLVLQNHGLVVGAETAIEAERLQTDVLNKLKCKPRGYKSVDIKVLNEFAEKFKMDFYLPKYEVIHTLATDPLSFKLVKQNPHCPDHAVFFGLKVPIINNINCDFGKIYKTHDHVIIKDIGVIIFRKNKSLEEMLKTQAEIFLRIDDFENVNTLSHEQCEELINWDAEKLRKKIM